MNMKIKKILKYTVISLLFFIVVANLTKFQLIAGGDNSWLINPFYLDRYYVWEKTNLGFFQNQIADIIPLIAFYKFFGLFKLSNNIIQTLYYLFFYLGSFLTFYFSFKTLFPRVNKNIIIIASLLYIFNPFVLVMPFHDRLFPVVVFLPLLFLFYYQLLHRKEMKYAILISLLSVFFSGSNINLPVVSVIFIIFASYFIYFLFSEKLKKDEYRTLFIQQFGLIIIYILINLWHLIVDAPSMLAISDVSSKVNQFRATGVGYFFDNLRLIGQWGWYNSHYMYRYFAFSDQYYKPILVVTTYGATFLGLAFVALLSSKSIRLRDRKLLFFFLCMFLLGALLSNGSKQTLGFFFNFFYNSSKVFWIFREPWAKFTPIMIFALPVLVVGTLSYISNKIKQGWAKNTLWGLATFIILLNAYPLFTGSAVWDKWNGTMRSFRVEVPSYWVEMNKYIIDSLSSDERIALFPYNSIYSAFNWPEGFFTAGNPGMMLINRPTITSTSSPVSYSDSLYNAIFDKSKDSSFNLKKYLGVLGCQYILQENDADWRFQNKRVLPPSVSNEIIKQNNFIQIAKEGEFSYNYLKQIPNDEPNGNLKDQLSKELLGRPALILYKSKDDKDLLPHFYAPKEVNKSNRSFIDLADIVSDPNYNPKLSVVFFSEQNTDQKDSFSRLPRVIQHPPEIEFKKINPTKYQVKTGRVDGEFILVFSESYNKDWKIYSKQVERGNFYEDWFGSRGISEKNHLVANGYANSWIVDAAKICSNNDKCINNPDGSYDIELTVEFWPQKLFYLGLLVSSGTFLGCIIVLIYYRRRKKGFADAL